MFSAGPIKGSEMLRVKSIQRYILSLVLYLLPPILYLQYNKINIKHLLTEYPGEL